MSVDTTTVRRIAHLARIAVKDEEVEHLKDELNGILAFVAQLDEVNVEGVEPMTSVTPMAMKKREDVVTDGGIAEDIVKNAPATEDHFFLVPKVVGVMCWACGERRPRAHLGADRHHFERPDAGRAYGGRPAHHGTAAAGRALPRGAAGRHDPDPAARALGNEED